MFIDRTLKSTDVYKGVNTFAHSTQSNILATAGTDKIVRTWHPHILNKPTGKSLVGTI